MTLQRLMSFSVTACMACSSAALAAATAVSAENAQALADKITKEILSAASESRTLEIQGKVEVTPENGAYVFTIPPVRASDLKSVGAVILTNKISGRFTPTEQPDTYNTIAAVPSLGDMLTKRLERTKASIQETLEAGGLEDFRRVVDALSATADPADIAAVAIKLAIVHMAAIVRKKRFRRYRCGRRSPIERRGLRTARLLKGIARVHLEAVRFVVDGHPERCGST